MEFTSLTRLSDAELVEGIEELNRKKNVATATLVALLVKVLQCKPRRLGHISECFQDEWIGIE